MGRNLTYKINKIVKKEIWSLKAVKDYLRITHDYDDKIIENLIESATQQAEIFMSVSLNTKYITLTSEKTINLIKFRHLPIIELLSIRALSMDSKDIKDDFGYLDIQKGQLNIDRKFLGEDIKIEYLAGYQEIPAAVSHGILNHIAVMYDRPDNITTLTEEVKNLYLPFRRLKLCV